MVLARLMVFGPWMLGNLSTDGRQRLLREVHRVGTHISNVPRLVERLSQAHGLRDGVAELVRSLLLQRRGSEGCGGGAATCTAGDALYLEGRTDAAL